MKLNPQKFAWLVENVDPSPIYQAITSGSLLQEQAAETAAQDPYASMLAMSPDVTGLAPGGPNTGGAPLPPQMMQQIMGQLGGGGTPAARPAPAAAPRQPGAISFPSVSIPRGLAPVPSLKDLLKGVPGGSF